MATDKTKKDLKKNDKNPFAEKIQKVDPFKVPDHKRNIVETPKLKKKEISDLITIRIDKEQHLKLKSHAVKNGYFLKELYEVIMSEFLEGTNQEIKVYEGKTTTIKVSKNVYLKLRETKYETNNSQSDIYSTAIEYYLRKK